jgi:hypothetical protein
MTGAPDAGAQQLLCDGTQCTHLVRIEPVHHPVRVDTAGLIVMDPGCRRSGTHPGMRSGRRPFRPGTRARHRKGQWYRHAQGRSATLRVDACAVQHRCRDSGASALAAKVFIPEGAGRCQGGSGLQFYGYSGFCRA